MLEFSLCVLYICIFILVMAVIYLIVNLVFTFKILFQTLIRLKNLMIKLEKTSEKAVVVSNNLNKPISALQKFNNKIKDIVSKFKHIVD